MQRKILRFLETARDWLIAQLVFATLKVLRWLPADAVIGLFGRFARFLAPILPRNKVIMNNLRIAFPEKSEEDYIEIRNSMWDGLARTTAEYAYLDQIFDLDLDNLNAGHIEIEPEQIEIFKAIRSSDKPAILFTGHLANWELLPVCAATFDLHLSSLFRAPNNRFIANQLMDARESNMGELVNSRPGAVYNLASVLERGGHVGLLVDQKFGRGVRINFFGQPATANPLLGKLARQYDCPVYGARVIRLPKGRFKLEITEALDLPRDANGDIDVLGTTVLVSGIVEGWIKEHPEQWLWAHKRWAL